MESVAEKVGDLLAQKVRRVVEDDSVASPSRFRKLSVRRFAIEGRQVASAISGTASESFSPPTKLPGQIATYAGSTNRVPARGAVGSGSLATATARHHKVMVMRLGPREKPRSRDFFLPDRRSPTVSEYQRVMKAVGKLSTTCRTVQRRRSARADVHISRSRLSQSGHGSNQAHVISVGRSRRKRSRSDGASWHIGCSYREAFARFARGPSTEAPKSLAPKFDE
jgi:hypothetical protein